MPVLGLGTWELTDNTAGTVGRALQLGYRMIDTACDYGSQAGIGEAIRRSGLDRESLYVVAKVEETDDAYAATRKYLAEIGLEYADLMLIHRPPERGVGEELWDGLRRAKGEGLAIDIGVMFRDQQ
jgi:2,5-diketo-D-gluconate reductase A